MCTRKASTLFFAKLGLETRCLYLERKQIFLELIASQVHRHSSVRTDSLGEEKTYDKFAHSGERVRAGKKERERE